MTIELLALLVVLLAVYAVLASNRFVRQQHLVEESARQVEVELRRRQDLVPLLVDTVRAYAQHDRGLLTELVEARQAAVEATGSDVPDAEARLTRALHALAPQPVGPELVGPEPVGPPPVGPDPFKPVPFGPEPVGPGQPSSAPLAPVQQLQAQLAETEDRIAAARRFHTANVRALETRMGTFPSSLVARATGVERPDDDGLSELERARLELPPDTR